MNSKKEKLILDDSSLNKPIYTKESIEQVKTDMENKKQNNKSGMKFIDNSSKD